jgi:flagellar assembly factor FliW
MDSVTHPEIGFVLLRPQVFFPDYLQKVELSSEETQLLEITDDQKVDVWVIMTLCLSNMAKTTANLRAPLLMNTTTQKGIQIILNDEDYSARQPIFGEEATRSAGADSGEGAVG